jgi:hypothetical protein
MMNKILPSILAAGLLSGCAASSYESLTPGAAPVSAAGAQQTAAHDARFANASTLQLQERRLDLYKRVPRFAKRYDSRHYTTTYETHGGPLPEQDEIVLIERELNWRYGHGDRAAYFSPAAPQMPPYSQQSGG